MSLPWFQKRIPLIVIEKGTLIFKVTGVGEGNTLRTRWTALHGVLLMVSSACVVMNLLLIIQSRCHFSRDGYRLDGELAARPLVSKCLKSVNISERRTFGRLARRGQSAEKSVWPFLTI